MRRVRRRGCDDRPAGGAVPLAGAATAAGGRPVCSNPAPHDARRADALTSWANLAPGIWRATAGDTSRELRYTDFAAAPPRLGGLRARPVRDFPFAAEPISFERTADGRIAVRVPCAAGEKLFGFGLQLDGLDRNQGVFTLNVDHWSTGGGRTHAPVPFYVSSRGYGVFIDTARFLKVYARVGNRKDCPAESAAGRPQSPARRTRAALGFAAGIRRGRVARRRARAPTSSSLRATRSADVVSRYNLLSGGGALPPSGVSASGIGCTRPPTPIACGVKWPTSRRGASRSTSSGSSPAG